MTNDVELKLTNELSIHLERYDNFKSALRIPFGMRRQSVSWPFLSHIALRATSVRPHKHMTKAESRARPAISGVITGC
jgi:hypothetical protein